MTFESKITKSGNIKISPQLRESLGLRSGQGVTVSLDCCQPDEIRISQNILNEAGICVENGLEIYADDGKIIIQEADEYDGK